MQIGELFLGLGVKGSDKTVGAITQIKDGLKETKDLAFETKAALVGAMYALERMFAKSGQTGTGLVNFNAYIGTDLQDTLQRYQFAARQVGLTNEEVTGTFQSLQGAMADIALGKGAPAGLAQISQLLAKFGKGGLEKGDIVKMGEHPELLLQKLQEFAQLPIPAMIRNDILKSMGLTPQMISALARNAFRPDVLAQAPVYSGNEAKALDQNRAAWSNLFTNIEMAIGHFNAKHGGELVKGISDVIPQVIKLAEAFEKLGEKAEVFRWLSKVFEGWSEIFQGITKAIEFINAAKTPDEKADAGKPEGDKSYLEDASPIAKQAATDTEARTVQSQKDFAEFMGKVAGWLFQKTGTNPEQTTVVPKSRLEKAREEQQKIKHGHDPLQQHLGSTNVVPFVTPTRAIAPTMPATAVAANGSTQNVSVQQTLNFQHEGKDARRTADSVKQAVNTAYRQMSAQTQAV